MEGTAWHLADPDGGRWEAVYLVCGDGVLSAFENDNGEPSIPAQLAGVSSNELQLADAENPAGAHLGPNDPGAPTNFGFSVTKGDDLSLRFCAATKQDLIKWRKAVKAEAAPGPGADDPPTPAPAPPEAGEDVHDASTPAEFPPPAPVPAGDEILDGSRGGDDDDVEKVMAADPVTEVHMPSVPDADETANATTKPDGTTAPASTDNKATDMGMKDAANVDPAIRAAPGEVLNGKVEPAASAPEEDDDQKEDDEDDGNEGDTEEAASLSEKGSTARKHASASGPPPPSTSSAAVAAAASAPPRVEPVYIGSQDPHGVQTIVILFEDTEVHISFRNQTDVDRVTVTELKGSLCMKLNAEPDCTQFLRPSELDLLLGEAVLREYWSGRDFGLRGGLQLHAKERSKIGLGVIPGSMSNARLVAQLKLGSRLVPVHLRDGEKPEDVAEGLAERLGLDAGQRNVLLLEIYRQMSVRVGAENASLRNQVGELLHRAKVQRAGGHPAGASQKSQEAYEALLDRAAQRIEALEKEKKQLSDQVFELRLVNAERLASLH